MDTYKYKAKLGRLLFKIWKKCFPGFQDFSQRYNMFMFKLNEMSKSFPWQKYANKKNPYFAKWGFKVSAVDAEYYSQVSGVKADHYVNRTMAVHFIYPYLGDYGFVPAYMDKNMQKSFVGLNKYDEELEVYGTYDIVCCMNGVFFNNDRREISRAEALEALAAYEEPMILKPSLETYGGHGVTMVEPTKDKTVFDELFGKYNYNFTFQRLVKQHPTLAAYNPTSINTIRIVTYRKPNRERKVLYSCLRFGGAGSVIDNVCSGGGYTGINIETGELRDRKRYSYFTMDMPLLADDMPNQIPCWEKIKKAALALHGRLPHFDIIGWDFSVTPEGKLTLIEYNLRPGIGLQQAVGPMFSKEELDELMESVSKVKYRYKVVGKVEYDGRLKKDSIIENFGFQKL